MLYGMVLILFTLKMPVKHLERSMDWNTWDSLIMAILPHWLTSPSTIRSQLKYGMTPRIDIIYRPTEAAKIVFDYEIHDAEDDSLIATGTLRTGVYGPQLSVSVG